MKITGRQAQVAIIALSKLNVKHEKNIYAKTRNIKKLSAITEELQEELRSEQINKAFEKDGVLVKDENGEYKYSRENTVHLEKFNLYLLKKEYDFEPHKFLNNDECNSLQLHDSFFLNDIEFLIEPKPKEMAMVSE